MESLILSFSKTFVDAIGYIFALLGNFLATEEKKLVSHHIKKKLTRMPIKSRPSEKI